MGHRDVLEDRVAPVGDRAHLEHFALALAEAVAGELAEGTLGACARAAGSRPR